MHDLDDIGSWLPLLSGLFIVALGVFVASIRPRTRPNVAFAAFAASFGGYFVLTNTMYIVFHQPITGARALVEIPRMALALAAAAGLAGLALLFPTPLRRSDWRLLVPPAALAVAYLASIGGVLVSVLGAPLLAALYVFTFSCILATLVGLHALCALRFANASDPREARRRAFLAGALVLYSGFIATAGSTGARDNSLLSPIPGYDLYYGSLAVALLVGAGLWLWATAKGPAPRTARSVALLTPFTMVLGILYISFDLEFGAVGIVRILSVTVLAYAMVRHQVLGIDLKVQWTISKGTVAAVFVAVFFIASEAAQEFLGGASGSQYVGILAAGALVFAIAPLSRLADRLAEKAVPVSSGGGLASPGSAEAESDYASALAAAMRDGRITPGEELALARLAERAGIGVSTATRIRHEVEALGITKRRTGARRPR
jgi:hypothetical protein